MVLKLNERGCGSRFCFRLNFDVELRILLYAGMDWTSYRKAHRRILGAAVVAVSDLEVLATAFGEARRLSGLPSDYVFHAYDDAPAIQLTLMQSVLRSALTIRVGVGLYDSAEGIQDAVERVSPADLTHDIGIRLLREFLSTYAVARLVVDSELEGKKRETKFKKEIRALRSSGHFNQIVRTGLGSGKRRPATLSSARLEARRCNAV